MIGCERRELLAVLTELSEARPEYRLGQMLANLVLLARGDAEGAVWDVEDEELLEAARRHLADLNIPRGSTA